MNTFHQQLNTYISQLGCSMAELSEHSGLSPATITRYCAGKREPQRGSDATKKLAEGLVAIAGARGLVWDAPEIEAALSGTLPQEIYKDFPVHFDRLISALHMSLTELSRNINFDASYLSRVRSGQRTPGNLDEFVDKLCRYVVRRYNDETSMGAVAELLGCDPGDLAGQGYYEALAHWFGRELAPPNDGVDIFIKTLDDFDLNEYIRTIHFDELKVPSMPFQLPASRNYFGLEQMKKGELDFFKATVLSRSAEPIFMCSDMPMEDMAEDLEFGKKWMFAIAMSIKKGLHLNIIHNVDRPFREMLLGLQSWIPIYMTGQVSPYHLKNPPAEPYQHLTYVSGGAALSGECICGHHAEGKYYLTNNKEELAYYRKRAKALLSRAQPLMEIYRKDDEKRWMDFLTALGKEPGSRRGILSAPPLFTISPETLSALLTRSGVPETEQARLLRFVADRRREMEALLAENTMEDQLAELSREEFMENPLSLSLSGAFCETDVVYTYEAYLAHLEETRNFARNHPGYTLQTTAVQAFRNIQIQILEDKLVVVSKNKAPTIQFVIRHPSMVQALQNFIPLVNMAE